MLLLSSSQHSSWSNSIRRLSEYTHAWRGDAAPISNLKSEISNYQDIPDFCKSATTAEIAAHGHVLKPGQYDGANPEVPDEYKAEYFLTQFASAEGKKRRTVLYAVLRRASAGGDAVTVQVTHL